MEPPRTERKRKRRFDVAADDAAPRAPAAAAQPYGGGAYDNVHPSRLPGGNRDHVHPSRLPPGGEAGLDAQQQRDLDELMGVDPKRRRAARFDDAGPPPAAQPTGQWGTADAAAPARPAFEAPQQLLQQQQQQQAPAASLPFGAAHPPLPAAPAPVRKLALGPEGDVPMPQANEPQAGGTAPDFRPRRLGLGAAAPPDAPEEVPAEPEREYTEEERQAMEPENVGQWTSYLDALRKYMSAYAAHHHAKYAQQKMAEAVATQLAQGAVSRASQMIAVEAANDNKREAELRDRARMRD